MMQELIASPNVSTWCHVNKKSPNFSLNFPSHEAYVDEKNKVISTPTFMWETDYHYHYIFDGIGNMVKHVMRMTAKWFSWDARH